MTQGNAVLVERANEPSFTDGLQGFASFCESLSRNLGGIDADDLEMLAEKFRDADTLITAQVEQITRLNGALRLHKAWFDSDSRGPDYGSQSRDTHPDGELIWRRWWDGQLDLCERANAATDAALSGSPAQPDPRDAEIERLRMELTEIADFTATEPWRVTARTLKDMARFALSAPKKEDE